jgi:lysozyme
MTTATTIANALRPLAPGKKLATDDVPLIDKLAAQWDARSQGKVISQAGIDLIKRFEGLRLKAYPDPATGGEPWTIGIGHTGGVRPGDVITEARAEQLLRQDVGRFERAVARLCPVTTQGQFSALVSFAFNVGEDNLRASTLRRLHNEGNYASAADQFLRWDKANGKTMAGLARRRLAERQLYLTSDDT